MTDAGTEQRVELHPVPGESTVWVTGHVESGFGRFQHIDGHRIAEGYVQTGTDQSVSQSENSTRSGGGDDS